RRRHTRCLSDWTSDVCSSDLNPQAALHLKMARDQLAEAQGLIDSGKNDEARLVLERANADAEVALMITREAEASAGVKKTQADEIGRASCRERGRDLGDEGR